jgi:HEAT repeat protein
MTARPRTTWIITGALGIAATAAGIAFTLSQRGKAKPETAVAATNLPADTTLPAIAEGLTRSDIPSLVALAKRLDENAAGQAKPLTATEANEWVGVVKGLKAGYLKFKGASARTTAIAAVPPILHKFTIEPAPSGWFDTLMPILEMFNAGLGDPDPTVRVAALDSIGKIWDWYPRRALLPIEESELGAWKDRFGAPVKSKLADRDPRTRAAAVACLALAPIDALAANAVAYLDDPQSGDVRHQVLVSFAHRPLLLTADMIIKRLHDPEPGIPQLAELILQTRGLTKDQVAMGRMITSPRPEMRASVIGLVKDREDLDPIVWLLLLSHDMDEMVRAKAVEAMNGKDSPDLRIRLREMASKDSSESIRIAAAKLVARLGGTDSTASLPPLPGSTSLTPKAN